MTDLRRYAPATERNREPILAVLRRIVPPNATVLEIAAGSGEHAVFFSEALAVASWQPTDADAASLPSIDAWVAHAHAARVRPARVLDVEGEWNVAPESIDVVLCVNMIHIAPWSATLALLDGAAKVLRPKGALVLYGPYRIDGNHTAPSNQAFDESLRSRDPSWGVRDLETVVAEASGRGLDHVRTEPMPANNFTLHFRRP